MTIYRCPVCGKSLRKDEYEKALGILGEREKHLKHELKQAEAKAREAKREGFKAGLARNAVEMERLREQLRQLKKGHTPQTAGLAFEDTLVKTLQHAFPGDDVKPTGKRGDVLHGVRFDKKPAGTIVYECKRVSTIPSSHIRQASRAKQVCQADFAVLVTTGRKRGFGGLAVEHDVYIVASAAVLPLVSLLRLYLIEMLRAKVTKEERARIAARLMDYATSPEFRNPIEEVVQRAADLKQGLLGEMSQHAISWQRRWDHYEVIRWNGAHVQADVQLVLQGGEPKAVSRPKVPPLELPGRLRELPPPREEPSR